MGGSAAAPAPGEAGGVRGASPPAAAGAGAARPGAIREGGDLALHPWLAERIRVVKEPVRAVTL